MALVRPRQVRIAGRVGNKVVRKLAILCETQSIGSILIDMRKTKPSESIQFKDLIDIASEFGRYSPSCTKIANVIPDDERESLHEPAKVLMKLSD